MLDVGGAKGLGLSLAALMGTRAVLVSLVFMPLGYVAAAPLAESIGTDTTLACLAGVNAAACIGILLVPSVRNMRRRDEAVEEPSDATEPALADAVL